MGFPYKIVFLVFFFLFFFFMYVLSYVVLYWAVLCCIIPIQYGAWCHVNEDVYKLIQYLVHYNNTTLRSIRAWTSRSGHKQRPWPMG